MSGETMGEQPISWAPEVFVDGKWHRNALRFATEQEAMDSAHALFMRWMLCTNHRATPASEPVNYALVDGMLKAVAGEP